MHTAKNITATACRTILILFASLTTQFLIAQEAPSVTALALNSPEKPAGVETATETVFAGQTHRMEWALRSDKEQMGKIRLSLYRVLTSTVVPIEEETILDLERRLLPDETSVVGYEFEVPDSTNAVRYLAKLWFENKGNAVLIGTKIIHAIPDDLLSQYKGVRLLLCGFGEDKAGLKKFFESCSWETTTATTFTGKNTADIVVTAPTIKTPPELGTNGLIYRDLSLVGEHSSASVTLFATSEKKKMVRYEIPVQRWTSLPHSAASQHLLASILAARLETP